MLTWGANAFARILLGLKAHDMTAGFRCCRRKVLESIALDQIFSKGKTPRFDQSQTRC